ncbi:MAG: hypothetical protein DWH81_09355 [Planctomycetota bacterium]|nr:MAG: hypothetical protein DWH81_09355 [Planctomycetota bacterium]
MRTSRIPSTVARSASIRSWAHVGLSLGLVFAAVGCQTVSDTFKLKDGVGTTSEDPWTTQAGSEGRAGRAVEKEADPLHLRRFLMSEKAMEIERNCGYE